MVTFVTLIITVAGYARLVSHAPVYTVGWFPDFTFTPLQFVVGYAVGCALHGYRVFAVVPRYARLD